MVKKIGVKLDSKKNEKDIILLGKLVEDTTNNEISWKSTIKKGTYTVIDKWIGEKTITKGKKLSFVLSFYSDDLSVNSLRVFIINNEKRKNPVVQQIYTIEPGLFDFKIKKLFEILIEKMKKNDKIEPMGPFYKDWDII